jgi:hypothetical protein
MLTACRSYRREFKEKLYKIAVRRSPLVGMAQRVHISVRDAAREIVRPQIDIPRTLTIWPGFPALVIVTRDLGLYAKVLKPETSQTVADPAKLTVPVVERFMAADPRLCEVATLASTCELTA